MKAYITCPCTHSQDKLKLLPIIKSIAENNGLETFVFEIGGTPDEIFQRDYNEIKNSDLIIAEVSEKSHGVGMEIGMSFCLGHKIILLHEKGTTITPLAQGLPNTKIIEYENSDDLKQKLLSVLKKI